MATEDLINKLEKKVIGLMRKIKNNEITPAESKIGKPLNLLKDLDLPLYEKLLAEYKIVLENYKKNIDNK
jgi:hypothetical protein